MFDNPYIRKEFKTRRAYKIRKITTIIMIFLSGTYLIYTSLAESLK